MKIKSALLALTFAVAAVGATYQGPVPPPKELKASGFMKGTWSLDLKMYDKGKAMGSVTGEVKCVDSMGGQYIESRHDSDMGGMKMTGLQLTSYDTSKKEYMAFWFDSMGAGLLELRGKLKGQTLVLESKMMSYPGMPGKMAFRATNAMKGANQMLFRLEMNTGKGWGKMLEGMMTRK